MEFKLKTKLLNIEIGKRSEASVQVAPEVIPAKTLESAEAKGAGGYSKLSYDKIFLTGMEMSFLKGVHEPYATIASVYKSIKAICDNVPQARPALFKVDKFGDHIEKVYDERFRILSRKPNERQNFSDFIQEWVGYYALYGEGMILKAKSIGQEIGTPGAMPSAIWVLNPSKAQEIVDYNTRRLVGWRYLGDVYPVDTVIHSRDFNPYHSFRGLAPLKPIDDEIQIDQGSLTYNNAFFKNDATPGFMLSTDNSLTKEQREALTEWWVSRYKGDRNAFKPAILEKGLKPVTVNQSFKDMQFIEQKKLMREEIMGIWRVPKALFNITEDLNYATFMGQMRIFWIYTLVPMIMKFEASMNGGVIEGLPEDVVFAMDLSNVPAFAEDLKDKMQSAKDLNLIGFTANEINKKLNLGFEDKPWRDDWWISFGMVTARQAIEEGASRDQGAGEPGAGGEPGADEGQEDEEGKQVKKASMRNEMILRSFLRRHSYIEGKMAQVFKKHFYKMRQKALSTSNEDLANGNVNIDWESMDESLDKNIRPLLKIAIEQGVDIGQGLLGKQKGIDDQRFEAILGSYLQVRASKIVLINQTMKNRIRSVIDDSIRAGESITDQTGRILSIGEDVRSKMREIFNSATVRANLIARTETTGAVNGGSLLYYDKEGIDKKEWITAHDEHVRESHRRCEQQGPISTRAKFVNGLEYPGDQNAGPEEVCNCRCTLAPVVE